MKTRFLIPALAVLLLFVPAALYAHVYLLECFPEQNSTVEVAPEKVIITFLGNIEPMFSKVEVFDSDKKKVSDKTTFREENTIMEAALDKDLAPGVYTVKWKCMSLDGHTQKGKYKFTLKA